MSIIAHNYRFVVGVDTHARHHVYSVICTDTGRLVGVRKFPASRAGFIRAISWVVKQAGDGEGILWVVEGTGSYGAGLTRMLTGGGFSVVEAPRVDKQHRYGVGKTDQIDSVLIARAALSLETSKQRNPRRGDGVRQAVRVLVTARELMTRQHTQAVNALTALVRTVDLGIDSRYGLSKTVIRQINTWRTRNEPVEIRIARAEAKRLARQIIDLDDQLHSNEKNLQELIKQTEAAPLLEETGYGAISVAKCLTAWSHHGRIQTEAQFAALAGVNPIPASSGNTVRHRLNRGGDRRLNSAIHTIAITKMTHDEQTRKYVEKRQKQGKTNREIRRCLKRYITRHIYRTLNTQPTT